jgi:hypothetical protein
MYYPEYQLYVTGNAGRPRCDMLIAELRLLWKTCLIIPMRFIQCTWRAPFARHHHIMVAAGVPAAIADVLL